MKQYKLKEADRQKALEKALPEFPVSFSDDETEAEAAQQSRNGFAVETLLHVFQTISDDGKIKTSRTIESVYGSFIA